MKPIFTLMALLFATFNAYAIQPLDLNYKANGNNEDRPSLIFNDGVNTYIQPKVGQSINVYNSTNEGPYIVVSGLPDTIGAYVNGKPITIEKLSISSKKPSSNEVTLNASQIEQTAPFPLVANLKTHVDLNTGDSLQKVIGFFCVQNKIKIDWQSSSDFIMKKKMTLNGDNPVKLVRGFLRDVGYEVGGNDSLIIVADSQEIK